MAPRPPWTQASLGDLDGFDFEAPVAQSPSADSQALAELFRAAAGMEGDKSGLADTQSARIFSMLWAVTGMHFKPQEPNEPFGPMIVFEGRRSAIPDDFRGPPLDVLAAMAERAKLPALRARLADVSWLLERKRGQFARIAAASYVEVVKKVESGALQFRFGRGDEGALRFEARDLLRRALVIERMTGAERDGSSAARTTVIDLRRRSLEKRLPVPALWFAQLDLDFRISDLAEVGKDIERLLANLPPDTDEHTVVGLWWFASRAYHFAKQEADRYRCQAAAAEQLAAMAERQPSAMLASSFLSDAIAQLHGIPGMKDRRKVLHHKLVDVQANIPDEMSSFSLPSDLTELVRETEQRMRHDSIRDKLFAFAMLSSSPDPAELVEEAKQSIREHPLASLFGTSHHDSEGKVIHRTDAAGFGDGDDSSAILNQIAQGERIRRHIVASGQIEAARQVLAREHYLSEEVFAQILMHSPFVPRDTLMTYSRGFTRVFQGDFVSALYILTPLLENSLRHVLKSHGHDVTNFDDSRRVQEDRTISSLFDQMRAELDAVFTTAIAADIERVFLQKPGPYIRHALSHGLMHDGDPYGDDSIYACWLIFRLCLVPLFRYRTRIALPFDKA